MISNFLFSRSLKEPSVAEPPYMRPAFQQACGVLCTVQTASKERNSAEATCLAPGLILAIKIQYKFTEEQTPRQGV
jgi:hypothetical protein